MENMTLEEFDAKYKDFLHFYQHVLGVITCDHCDMEIAYIAEEIRKKLKEKGERND